MRNTVVFFSDLSIWSVGNKIGAPSFYETLCGYVRNGWKVILVVPYELEKNVISGIKIVTAGNVKVIERESKYAQFFSNLNYNRKLDEHFLKCGKKVIEEEIKEVSKLVIYAYEVHAVRACKILAKMFQMPLVTRFQGTIMSCKKDNLLTRIGYYPHYQALKQSADLCVMTDDGTSGETYQRHIGNKSRILFLRNGVDIVPVKNIQIDVRKELGISKEDKVLMTVSRLANWKRVDRAISAMPFVIEKIPNTKLIIVGDGDERKRLEGLSKQLGVSNNVIFVGAVKQSQVPVYLECADLFLSLYDIGNVGNPIYEAMRCGKTILTINNGDTASLLTNGENAVLLDVEQLDQIPQSIVKLLKDDETSELLAQNAQKYAEQNFWSWEERMAYECEETEKLLQ